MKDKKKELDKKVQELIFFLDIGCQALKDSICCEKESSLDFIEQLLGAIGGLREAVKKEISKDLLRVVEDSVELRKEILSKLILLSALTDEVKKLTPSDK